MTFIRKNPAVLVLAGVIIYLGFLLSSYQYNWMLPEELRIKSYILEKGPSLSTHDLTFGLNWWVFENAPRVFRPLSSYFEIVDAKFRVWLWHFILPHPSLSLAWIFSLILSPLLLYRLLRNMDVQVNTALGAVSLYLMSPGLLSTVVMLFRPGKAMTNFALILCLYLASRLPKPVPFKKYLGLLCVMFISVFWDETAVLVFFMVPLFFPFLLRDLKRFLVYLCIPALVYVCYFYVLPWAVKVTGNPAIASTYEHMPQLGIPAKLFLHYCRALAVDTGLLLGDSLGFILPSLATPWPLTCLMAADMLVIVLAILYFGFQWKKTLQNPKVPPIWLLFLGGGALALFHTYLMIQTYLKFWGLFYYGAYWSVFFVVAGGVLLSRFRFDPAVFTAGLAVVCLCLGVTFRATDTVYKKFHYENYSPLSLIGVFIGDTDSGRLNPIHKPLVTSQQIKNDIKDFWQGKSADVMPQNFWVAIETHPQVYGYVGRTYLDKVIAGESHSQPFDVLPPQEHN